MEKGSKADEILTLAFMVLAVAALVCFFAVSNRTVFLICGGAAVVMRIVQYILRFVK